MNITMKWQYILTRDWRSLVQHESTNLALEMMMLSNALKFIFLFFIILILWGFKSHKVLSIPGVVNGRGTNEDCANKFKTVNYIINSPIPIKNIGLT